MAEDKEFIEREEGAGFFDFFGRQRAYLALNAAGSGGAFQNDAAG
jgi:hypothetical protein